MKKRPTRNSALWKLTMLLLMWVTCTLPLHATGWISVSTSGTGYVNSTDITTAYGGDIGDNIEIDCQNDNINGGAWFVWLTDYIFMASYHPTPYTHTADQPGQWNFEIYTTNNGVGPIDNGGGGCYINDTPPTPSCNSFSTTGTVGMATTIYASGSNVDYWTYNSGLPPGMSWNSGGYFSGTPTKVGTYYVSVTANNSYGSDTGTITVTVGKGTPTITWATPAAIAYGTALTSSQLNATVSGGSGGGMLTYSPVAGTVLNTGTQTLSVTYVDNDSADYNGASASVTLVVNKATATVTLSGLNWIYTGSACAVSWRTNPSVAGVTVTYNGSTTAPTTAGSYTVVATVNDSNYQGTTTATMTIAPASPNLSWVAPAAITYPTPLSSTQLDATAVDNNNNPLAGTFTYNYASGTVLSPGTYSLSAKFTPTDTVDYVSGDSVSTWLTVNPPAPVITSASSCSALINQPFSFQPTASNTPTSWAATGLPAGLSINTTSGLISGTPTTTGASTVRLSATNAGGTGTQTLTISVYAQPTFTSTTFTSGEQNITFNFAVSATGNVTSYSASGLPTGLSINTSNGLISGTPSVYGTYSVTLTASNPGGSQNQTLTISIVQTFQLTATASPVAGGTVTGSGLYDVNTPAPVTASANANYRFGGWGGPDGTSVASPSSASTSINMTSAKSVVATFISTSLLTVNAGTGGTVTGGGTFDTGSTVPISAAPSNGQVFAGWIGPVADPSNASTTVTLTGPTTITGTFTSSSPSATVNFGQAYVPNNKGYAPITTTKTAAVSDSGNMALSVSKITYAGDFTPTLKSMSVNAGGSSNVIVTFAPTVVGTRTGTISFFSNDSTNSVLTYTLTGTGLSAQPQPPTVSAVRDNSNQLKTGDTLSFTVTGTSLDSQLTELGAIVVAPDNSQAGPTYYAPGGTYGTLSHDFSVVVNSGSGTYTVLVYAQDSRSLNTGWLTAFTVSVAPNTTQQTINSYAVPAPGLEIWFTPSAVNSSTYTIQH